jgi:thymidylate synthase
MIKYGPNDYNQLDFILKSRLENGNRRRSILQIAIVEPEKDITNQRVRGFPCLQQVSFAPFGNGELAVNGFYGSQYIYDKAYGNYVGLLNLGRFVAHELGLKLTQLNCFTGIACLGNVSKASVSNLAGKLRKLVGR